MIKLSLHKSIVIGAIFTFATFFGLVLCKSIDKHIESTEESPVDQDPLQAVANEEYQYFTSGQPEVQYHQLMPTSLVQEAHQHETVSSGQQQQVIYEVRPQQEYYISSQPEQVVYENEEQQTHDQQVSGFMFPQDQHQDQQQYQGSNYDSKPHEYPGEILYVEKTVDGSQLQQQSPELASLGNTIAKNSGLPATILTEVPVKDMPLDVLEKLKRDYGVKVVATRERPGANLVINCEHQQDNQASLCANQRQVSSIGLLPPYSLEQPAQEMNQPLYVSRDNQNSDGYNEDKQHEGYGAEAQRSGYGSSENESTAGESKGEYYDNERSEENSNGEREANLEHNDQRPVISGSSYGNRNPVATDESQSEQESNTHEKQEELSSTQKESKSQASKDEAQHKEN